jgi:hypothetical protein
MSVLALATSAGNAQATFTSHATRSASAPINTAKHAEVSDLPAETETVESIWATTNLKETWPDGPYDSMPAFLKSETESSKGQNHWANYRIFRVDTEDLYTKCVGERITPQEESFLEEEPTCD